VKIPFGDLSLPTRSLRAELQAAIDEVLDSGWFVLGRQVAALEAEFAAYCGARFAVGVGSGTAALQLALVALGIRAGDEVITVPNTAVPTASAISLAQAQVALVEVDSSLGLMNAARLDAAITDHTRALVPVHLYGHPVDLDEVHAVARRHHLPVIEDAAQAHGARYRGRRIGAHSPAVCFSFYPSKNLGALGDGGAIVTDLEGLRDELVLRRNYGSRARYQHEIKGSNSRLDELQAALLRVKLRHLDRWNARRRELAETYRAGIQHPLITLPLEADWAQSCWHLFVVRARQREALRRHLEANGIGTQIHYPTPIHLQPAYAELGFEEGAFPVAEAWAREALSLPLYPELTDDQVATVIASVNRWSAPPL